ATVAAAGLAMVGVGGYAAWSERERREADRRTVTPQAQPSALEVRESAMMTWLTSLRDLACRCTDERCVGEVGVDLRHWSEKMMTAPPVSPGALKQITELSENISACMTRATVDMILVRGGEAARALER